MNQEPSATFENGSTMSLLTNLLCENTQFLFEMSRELDETRERAEEERKREEAYRSVFYSFLT